MTTEPTEHKAYSTNGVDAVFYQPSPNSLRFCFLQVTETFDTPAEPITNALQAICDTLNEG